MRRRRRLFVVRRQWGGAGGAERVAKDFSERFGQTWDCQLVHAGLDLHGIRIRGARGPGWLRALQFTQDVDRLISKAVPDAVLSLERGPGCDVYRAGEGVHRRSMQIKYKGSFRWMVNPLHWVMPQLEVRTLRAARRVVANSDMVAGDLLNAYPWLESRVSVIRNGFDPGRFCPGGSVEVPGTLLDANLRCLLFLGSGWERK